MNRTIDDYFDWLVSRIFIPNNSTYIQLFERMYNLEFVWTVPHDDNRIQDALDLRAEFVNGSNLRLNLEGVSFLEVFVALSRRAAFLGGGDPGLWTWKLLKNLHLHKMADPLTVSRAERVDDILNTVVWRTYHKDGEGGFFPLHKPAADQTKIEIWDQLNAYILEGRRI